MSREPLPALPHLALASAAVPGLTAVGWQALTVPKGTPEATIRKLTDDLRKVLQNSELQKQLLATGSEFEPLFGAELERFIGDEEKYWWPLVRKYSAN
jgi:tripartite-type tricarboxylate transporter receptor subunit TctC